VFTFIPDHCSGSSRISVRHHPGIAFTFPRNPHLRFVEIRAGFEVPRYGILEKCPSRVQSVSSENIDGERL
jgi:hypothetical protein